jgi:Transposase DNA-binding
MYTAMLLGDQPEKLIPDACPDWATTKATYQFFANDQITPNAVIIPHRNNTIERMKQYPTMTLFIQDTSTLNFSTHNSTNGLGPYSTDQSTLEYTRFTHAFRFSRQSGWSTTWITVPEHLVS